jgi:hypothetical protein
MAWIYFRPSALRRFLFLLVHKNFEVLSLRVVDLTPPIPLDDGWSLASFGTSVNPRSYVHTET